MITINDYTATPLRVCVDCAEFVTALSAIGNKYVGLDADPETGEILEPSFGKSPCDVCDTRLAGDRYSATLLEKTTTVRGN